MSPARSPGTGQRDFDALLLDFDKAWQTGAPPRIEQFLPAASPGGDPGRRDLLEELVKLDLEYRWRQPRRLSAGGTCAPERPRLEEYVKRYSELGGLTEVSVELIGWEYLLRHRLGDHPTHAEYAARFAQQRAKLREILSRIDSELASEFAVFESAASEERDRCRASPGGAARSDSSLPPGEESPRPAPPSVSAAALVDAICRCDLVHPTERDELTGRLQPRFPEARALARELLQRNWLTPYQVNQLLQGRGADLVLGPYVLLERLGEGGVGQVFRARHRKMDRVVALKLIRRELLTDAEVLGRFYREIEVVSRLDHPNVVHAYDAGPAGPTHFLAMEYVEGTDLAKLVKQKGPLPVAQACDYISQAALGLQHAHEKGLVHRDVKPHNLILSQRDGLVKVADLGLARLQRAVNQEATAALTTGSLTPVGAVMMGTADYLAPEQALDFHKADIRADIYSLGCTFYFLLTGQPPFVGGNLAEKVARHMNAEPPAVEQLRPDVPKETCAVLRKMMAKRPEERYQTPGEVAEAYSPAAYRSKPAGHRSRWFRRPALAGAVVFGLIALLSLWALWPSERMPSPLDKLEATNIPVSERFPDPPRGKLVAVLHEPEQRADTLALSPDCGTLALLNEKPVLNRRSVRLWDLDGVAPRGKESLPIPAMMHKGLKLAMAPNGRWLAVSTFQITTGPIYVWDLAQTPRQTLKPLNHGGAVHALAFAPDGTTLVSGGNNRSVQRWDLSTGEQQQLAAHKSQDPSPKVLGVAFSADGKTLAFSGTEVPVVRFLDLSKNSPERLTDIPVPAKDVHLAGFSPDGRPLVCYWADDNIVRLWDRDPAVRAEKLKFEKHTQQVTSVVFSPDGKLIASADIHPDVMDPSTSPAKIATAVGRLIIWDTATGTIRRDWKLPGGGILSLAWAADGRHLLVGNRNGRVYVFRLTSPP